MSVSRSESYKAAGVDVTAGYEAVKLMKPMVESTFTKGVMGTLGGFGGLFRPDFNGMKDPILVSGTDGVGTKLKLAFLMDKHDTVGIDCVAMCVNDIACCGAQPLFFLDYVAVGKNHPEKIAQMVSGIAEGCRQAGCALIGGETAEMPGFYPENEYDMAGFSVGMVDKEKMIDGTGIKAGDALIGVASSGVHSNGYSLVRKTLGINEKSVRRYIDEFGKTLGEELLTPTKIYVKAIQSLMAIGSGGVTGLGLGNGRQKFLYLPEAQNDFIFAVVCEELGLIGACLILLLFALLIIRGYWLALHARDKFGSLIIVGITTLFAFQVFANVAVVTNLFPVTGISLPFFSSGGSALIIQMAEMGLILSISRQNPVT